MSLPASLRQTARQYLQQDRYPEALAAFKTILTSSPSDPERLRAMADIACCYYMVNDFPDFKKWTISLYEEFLVAQPGLELTDQIAIGLGLGKSLEEIAFLAESLKVYEAMIKEDSIEKNLVRQKIFAQILRLLAMQGHSSKLEIYYQLCEQFKARDADAEIDLQHGLIQADFVLFGKSVAKIRLESFIKRTKLRSSDQRLLVFDFLYECLKADLVVDRDKKLTDDLRYEDCDFFERIIWDILHNRHSENLLWTEELSPLSAFRYLFLLNKRHTNLSHGSNQKFNVLAKSLSSSSLKMLALMFPQELNSKTELQIDIKRKLLVNGNESFDISRSKYLLMILEGLTSSTDLPVEPLIQKLFQVPYNFESFERLRMIVKRANNLLSSFTGNAKTLQLTKTHLSTSSFVFSKHQDQAV